MQVGPEEQLAQDVGTEGASVASTSLPVASGAPSWPALFAVGVAIAALLGAYALGRSADPPPRAAPDAPVATAIPPTAIPPTALPTAIPAPPLAPQLVDMLGEGAVLAEFDLGDQSRAVIWCRESVPGTQISSTLALIHVAASTQFGDQIVLYEELTKPWVTVGSGRQGRVLETEGLAGGNFGSPEPIVVAQVLNETAGTTCESCAPEQITLGGGEVLVGSCIHQAPLRGGIVYVIAPPVRAGQTPLALHVSCGVTTVQVESDQLVVDGEAPFGRGLYEARFPFPAVTFVRTGGQFVASDLELLNWNCDIDRSSHLADRHSLRTEPTPSISFERRDSAIGEIGVHGPMVLGLQTEQCNMLTRAWWSQPDLDNPTGTPIADLLGLEPPPGERDWFYSCHQQ